MIDKSSFKAFILSGLKIPTKITRATHKLKILFENMTVPLEEKQVFRRNYRDDFFPKTTGKETKLPIFFATVTGSSELEDRFM